ncbi:MAG TPA: uroporphyrinogen decarboxylase [Candidatus Limnocylindrales bacterium]|nr:uroporphyrinogen decarboxylase [Candidatus Limnocylindrales bacterium]
MNDRFLRACRLEPVDATPVWFMRQAGRSLPEYRAIRARASLEEIVADPALCAEVTLQPVRRLGVDAAVLFADITTPLPGIGIEVRIVDGVGPVIDVPIRTRDDLARLRPFEPETSVSGLLAAIRLLRAELDVPLIGFAAAPFTLAAYVAGGRASRDATAIKRLLLDRPGVADRLLATLADLAIEYLRAQVAAGVQAVQLFDSWAGALSPDLYRDRVAPHSRRVFEAIAGLGVPAIHFTTGTAGFLEEIAAAGGDMIGVDWRIRLDDAWARIGRGGIQGNLDPAALLGPRSEMERAADAVLSAARRRPGHVFNLGHGVLPETNHDDLARLVDLVHERSAVRAAA